MFNNIYKGKTVFVTGHTGFKGSWLSLWLTSLGARVVGYSAYIPSEPSNFEVCGIEQHIEHITGDIRDLGPLKAAFEAHRPDMVFHLAAQPLVRTSYRDPKTTFDTNVGGTVNVLECIRTTSEVKTAVMITSDKCYKNVEWIWGYRENDALGGDDPYSASKACAELVCHSYIKSFLASGEGRTRAVTTRAGNAIGGGDWAADRIVSDCVRAWAKGEEPLIRNPGATRPWQHLLEPLSGYLWLGANLWESEALEGEAFNFGPDYKEVHPVGQLIEIFLKHWGQASWKFEAPKEALKESTLLKLSCDKALNMLKWHSILSFDETVRMTAQWYKAYYGGEADMYAFTLGQIEAYAALAVAEGLPWAAAAAMKKDEQGGGGGKSK